MCAALDRARSENLQTTLRRIGREPGVLLSIRDKRSASRRFKTAQTPTITATALVLPLTDMAVLPTHQRRGLRCHPHVVVEASAMPSTSLIERIHQAAPPEPYMTLLADEPGHQLYARHGVMPTAPHAMGMKRSKPRRWTPPLRVAPRKSGGIACVHVGARRAEAAYQRSMPTPAPITNPVGSGASESTTIS
jgi:hypothetical protein